MALDLMVRVAAKTHLAQGIDGFNLVPMEGARLPVFAPGAHIDLVLPGELIRQYSLCNDAIERQRYCIAVLREPDSRGGSIALHDKVRVGDVLRISALRNRFRLRPAQRTLLLAGGIGITPLLPMARQLARMHMDFALHYYMRSRSRAAFLDELAAAPWVAQVTLHVSDEQGSARGRLADMLAALDAWTHVYACGPAGFVAHVMDCMATAGIDERQIHYEPFALPAMLQPKLDGPAFNVVIRSTGKVYTIPADEPPTRALARQGVRIPVSCEEGSCGTCETRVLEGIPDHRDTYLGAEARASHRVFMPCCSRALTPVLVLDL